MLTKSDLVAQIKQMGIQPTDTVLIHTSLRAIGPVEGGADTVIDAFIECLPDGLFLVPTHTWDNVKKEQPHYDVNATVPCIGTLPTVAAFRKDGVRSLHPTHSIWAAGRRAAEYVAGEENAPTPGKPGFAWARLKDEKAKILLIGVVHNRDTFIHAVEEMADVPDRLSPEPYEVFMHDHDGSVISHPFYPHKCSRSSDVSRQYINFEPALIACGAQQEGKLGNARVRIVDAEKCAEVVMRIISRADRDLCIEMMDIPEEWYR